MVIRLLFFKKKKKKFLAILNVEKLLKLWIYP